MSRVLSALVIGLLVSAAARADIPPPPGFKRISVENKITTEKTLPDYLLFAVTGGGPVFPVMTWPITLDPKAPVEIPLGGGRNPSAKLVAVPKAAAKTYPSEEQFLSAVAAGKVAGQLKANIGFGGLTEVKATDPRKSVVLVYKLESIDPKKGIVLTPVKEKDGPVKRSPGEGSEEESPDAAVPTGLAPAGQGWVAGLAACAAVVFGGLWLARRVR